jgi:ferredoxin/flavodoxin---NADP+ reductase
LNKGSGNSMSENSLTMGSAEAVQSLRETHYNATLLERIDIHHDLFRLRVRPDDGFKAYDPGQYVALGLGNWEPRIQPSQEEILDERRLQKVVRRAYSISCPMLSSNRHSLLTCSDVDYLEFYITLVRHGAELTSKAPALTPRLFMLRPGDRLIAESKITGHYTLAGVKPDDTVLMISTGTGEAPHNAMTAHLLKNGHRGKIINTTTVRNRIDLGYLDEHQRLMDMFPQYRYLPMSTRDPENLDPSHPSYVGKQYIQQWYTSGRLAELADDPLSPSNTHVFLCGNPAMIGIARSGEPPAEPLGMLPLLVKDGFTNEEPGPGHVRFEKYW